MLLDLVHRRARKRFHTLGFHSRTQATSVGTLHYLERTGEGEAGTIVFVHGLGTSSNTWLRTIPRIVDRRTVLLLDLPGFGYSSVSGADGFAPFHDHQKALAEFLASRDFGALTLVGHSLGGWLSASYATQHPDRVHHLVLINAVGVYFRGIERLRELFILESVEDTKKLLYTMWYRYPWFLKPLAGPIFREIKQRRTNEIVFSIEAQDLLVEELTRLPMPVSLIWGRNDGLLSLEIVESMLRLIPRCQVDFIEQCGHVPQLERPEHFVLTLRNVLKRVE